MNHYKSIVVAIDGSKEAEYAFHKSIDVAKRNNDSLLNIVNVIEYGSPKTVITKELANVTEADLIICGATGLNAVERFFIGSVSKGIVRSASCDVLVVRTPI